MFNDVVDLWDFYGSSMGQVARRMIRRRIRQIWPSVQGESVLGLGYATPYLSQFATEAERVIAIMPAQQGVLNWPIEGAGQVILADESELPLQDVSVDRVVLIHALECSEQLRAMLDEVWRVMSGNGRLLVVAPNRSGIWARSDRTPFGHGHPYSPSQLTRLLRDHQFTPTQREHALFMPPYPARLLVRSSGALEKIGGRWFPRIAGVVMVEASKQIYASRPKARTIFRRPRVLMPSPVRQIPTASTGLHRAVRARS